MRTFIFATLLFFTACDDERIAAYDTYRFELDMCFIQCMRDENYCYFHSPPDNQCEENLWHCRKHCKIKERHKVRKRYV